MQSTLAVLAMAAVYAPAQAQTTPYTTSTEFLATLQPGAYTETFSVTNPAWAMMALGLAGLLAGARRRQA
jgi:MYXO-CTERM domain-containing protein